MKSFLKKIGLKKSKPGDLIKKMNKRMAKVNEEKMNPKHEKKEIKKKERKEHK